MQRETRKLKVAEKAAVHQQTGEGRPDETKSNATNAIRPEIVPKACRMKLYGFICY